MTAFGKNAKRLLLTLTTSLVVVFLAISVYGNSSPAKELQTPDKTEKNQQKEGLTIKAGLHIHTGDDKIDKLSYSTYKLIDAAKKLGFDAIALTFHENVIEQEKFDNYSKYAAEKNILLIRGIEATIEEKHVVILNCQKDAENVRTFAELREYKKQHPETFIMAPHPFVPDKESLFQLLEKNIDIFDAIELSVFSNKTFNFNEKAESMAKKYGKPVVATADVHFLGVLNRGYALINAKEKTTEEIFSAIKKGDLENRLDSLSPEEMIAHKIKVSFLAREIISLLPKK